MAVKPGGKLVYATCSLEREENEEDNTSFDVGQQLQMNAYYRLLHNLMRAVAGFGNIPLMRIKVRCEGSPLVVIVSVDRAVSESRWQVDVIDGKDLICGPMQGTFHQICDFVVKRERLNEEKWQSWFNTSRRRLHITVS